MNFPAFGGHFPSTIPSIHQFTADTSGGVGVRYGNHFTNSAPIGVPGIGKYRSEGNNIHSTAVDVMINNKNLYTNGNPHHYNVPYSNTETGQQRLSESPNMQEKRNYQVGHKI